MPTIKLSFFSSPVKPQGCNFHPIRRPADTIEAVQFSLGGTSTLPLYAYRCTQCGHKFEKIQNFSADPETVCPQCGGLLERPLTAPRLNFKGAGWYINDYAPKSSSDTSSSESASSETKPAAKPETAAPAKSESSTPSPAPAAPASTPSSTT
jgi:putative FmdB family regulatory protein